MRIIAGEHRGRRLRSPRGQEVRPTSDRAREALFAILGRGEPALRGAAFLDLFCGTGAVGLEALSRGAAQALLLDNDPRVVALARANVLALGLGERALLRLADATRLGRAPRGFDIAFLDPPYHGGLAAGALAAVLEGGWLARPCRVVVELAAAEPLAVPAGLAVEQERRYGAGRFVFLAHAA